MDKIDVKGFTFLEIMLVLAVIGLIIAFAIPNISSSSDYYNMHTFAKVCVSDLRYAQQLGINTKEEHGIDFKENYYELINNQEVIKRVNYKNRIIFDGIENVSSSKIIFNKDGAPFEAGNVIFKSTASDLRVYIKITPETGGVSIKWD